MLTPVSYLHNNLRFEIVRRFIEGLGGILASRSGSRIALKLNGVTTSIYLHNSQNGALEAGRINSLREFILKASIRISSD